MKAPYLVFTKNDSKLFSLSSNYDNKIIWGKSLLNKKSIYNSDLCLVDAVGNVFFIKEFVSLQKIDLIESIKKFCVMVEVKPILYKDELTITLDNLKIRVWNCVSKNKSFWISMDDGRGIEKMIFDTNNFKELILLFR